ncbi:MAG TPA: type II toxin-antitoxin system RelE/ParE family toxin [Rhodanobacteraceae bacterium]|jgi:mRNA interferase RelE/StbE|nr:type II toxin-antitoxin system RelE/ParE family toxin [Rhodanobacteraceae bacterium]
MARYELIYLPSITKDLRGLPKADVRKILRLAESLRDDPRPSGSVKLLGEERYRVRQGDYRIVYAVDDGLVIVTVVKIGHRRDVYRN